MISGLIRLVLYFGFAVLLFKFVNRLLVNMGKLPISLRKRIDFQRMRRDPNVIEVTASEKKSTATGARK
jgi:hypothetical protein